MLYRNTDWAKVSIRIDELGLNCIPEKNLSFENATFRLVDDGFEES